MIGQAAFARRLNPGSPAPIAVALSGGGDSLMALLAAKAWADANGRRLIVLNVDHGLQAHGSPARVLPWIDTVYQIEVLGGV